MMAGRTGIQDVADQEGTVGELTLSDIVAFVRSNFVLISVLGAAGLVAALVYITVAAPIYRAEAVLLLEASDESGGGMVGQLAGQLGGLASLAGVSIGGNDHRERALQLLKSRRFTSQFIEREGIMPVLFKDEWDARAKRWKSLDPDDVPTIVEAVEIFNRDVRSISEDKRTGAVTVAVEWDDRTLAADWANGMVSMADQSLRAQSILEANRNLEFMRTQLQKTEIVEMRAAIYRIMESQLKAIMLAQSRPEFAFHVVDPATVPDADRTVRPKVALSLAMGIFAGLLVGIAAGAIRTLSRRRR